MLLIGKVLKVHGLKGEFKVQSYLDSPVLFKKTSTVIIKGKEHSVQLARVSGEFVILKIKDIDTPEQALFYVNSDIYCEKEELPSLPQGRYYIDDLLGCLLYDKEEKIGKIIDVLQNGSADILVLKIEGKEIMLPWVKGVFEDIDITNKKIIVNKKVFDEVAVYED